MSRSKSSRCLVYTGRSADGPAHNLLIISFEVQGAQSKPFGIFKDRQRSQSVISSVYNTNDHPCSWEKSRRAGFRTWMRTLSISSLPLHGH